MRLSTCYEFLIPNHCKMYIGSKKIILLSTHFNRNMWKLVLRELTLRLAGGDNYNGGFLYSSRRKKKAFIWLQDHIG